MKKITLSGVGLGVACAACCAPLLMPVLGSAGLAGLGTAGGGVLFGLSIDAIMCGGIGVALLVGLLVWKRRSLAARDGTGCNPRN